MSHRVTCREHGFDCDFEVTSENETELIEFVRTHAKSTHDLSVSDDDVRGMMHSA
ncbi:DUF1059 domain-containing protein [Haloprofundus marisrubri]|uniref:DUF1059 domain-containing protein n=1 Tax=Haloprofundus marisrubri TaxID=1514971 RepID=UPI0009E5A90B|nr:DUF1059 domain-containing protein [Haloprofundus marisrubri]